MIIFNSYVKLPEANGVFHGFHQGQQWLIMVIFLSLLVINHRQSGRYPTKNDKFLAGK